VCMPTQALDKSCQSGSNLPEQKRAVTNNQSNQSVPRSLDVPLRAAGLQRVESAGQRGPVISAGGLLLESK
jgi:hypothetical protein